MIRRLYSNISSPLIFFIVLALLTVWLDYVTRPPEHDKGDDLYRNPDYIAENIVGVRIDHTQDIQRQFSARMLLHYLNEEVTQLNHISFVNLDPEKPLMHISADRALVKEKGKRIDLIENVTAVRGTSDDKGKITLVTDFLHLNPNENLITTDHAVTITRFKTKIEAKGLEFNNRIGEMKLLSAVKAVNNK